MSAARKPAGAEAGFALILAILALLILTLLGLTLAATTATEGQISTNYRWSQQAYYNAEAGVEAAKAILRTIGDASLVLPPARTAGWEEAEATPTNPANWPVPLHASNDAWGNPSRNRESGDCDGYGNGAGYGVVLDDGTTPELPLQNVTQIFGHAVNGAFTVWVRREIVADPATGLLSDQSANDRIVITAEGTAPFVGAEQATDFAQTHRATRTIEAVLSLREGCQGGSFEQASSSGFRGCGALP